MRTTSLGGPPSDVSNDRVRIITASAPPVSFRNWNVWRFLVPRTKLKKSRRNAPRPWMPGGSNRFEPTVGLMSFSAAQRPMREYRIVPSASSSKSNCTGPRDPRDGAAEAKYLLATVVAATVLSVSMLPAQPLSFSNLRKEKEECPFCKKGVPLFVPLFYSNLINRASFTAERGQSTRCHHRMT